MKKKLYGFTLIELMVVIAIIGLLASIITVSLNSARAKSRDAKRIADIRTIQLALESYYNDNLGYPVSVATLQNNGYLSNIPKDPGDNSSSYPYYALGTKVGLGGSCPNSQGAAYHLGAGLEDATNPALKPSNNADAQGAWGALCICAGTSGFNTTCSGSYTTGTGFNGKAQTTASGNVVSCQANTDIGLGTSQCYDVTN